MKTVILSLFLASSALANEKFEQWALTLQKRVSEKTDPIYYKTFPSGFWIKYKEVLTPSGLPIRKIIDYGQL